jgi:hypothetical protein
MFTGQEDGTFATPRDHGRKIARTGGPMMMFFMNQ